MRYLALATQIPTYVASRFIDYTSEQLLLHRNTPIRIMRKTYRWVGLRADHSKPEPECVVGKLYASSLI